MIRVAAYVAIVLGVLLATAFAVRDLLPPKAVRFAAGIEGGGYWAFAERYRDILAEDGIDLQLLATAGSVENARLLAEGAADAGFLQGGIAADPRLETLGAVFTEPLLVFARLSDGAPAIPTNAARWRDLSIAAGPDGSGTRAAVEALLAAAGLDAGANTLLPLGAGDAANAVVAGQADVAIFVAPLSAGYLQPVLSDPSVGLVALDHAVSLSRRMAQTRIVDVPSGAFQLDPPLPPVDRVLLGMVARIAADPRLSPAAVDRLVEAASRVHGSGDVLTPEGAFPTMDHTDLPQDAYARDRLADGPSALGSVLPYWMVAQINRFAILLLPVVFLLLPLLRALPGLYRFRIRSRVFRHYARIREIEAEATRTDDAEVLGALDAELAALDLEIARLNVPLSYRDYAYDARLHIDLLRRKIAQVMAPGQGTL